MGMMSLETPERVVLDVPMGDLRVFGNINGSILITINGVLVRDATSDPVIRALAWEVQALRERLEIWKDGGRFDVCDDGCIQQMEAV